MHCAVGGNLGSRNTTMLYCYMFGGLVYPTMYLLLFRVVLFSSTQSLALKHPQVYCMLKDAMLGFVSIQTISFVLWVDLYRAWT